MARRGGSGEGGAVFSGGLGSFCRGWGLAGEAGREGTLVLPGIGPIQCGRFGLFGVKNEHVVKKVGKQRTPPGENETPSGEIAMFADLPEGSALTTASITIALSTVYPATDGAIIQTTALLARPTELIMILYVDSVCLDS